MLVDWLGAETFAAGVRVYLRRHRFGNATTRDLWTALGETAGRDVAAMMTGWTRRIGFPVVAVDGTGAVTQVRARIHRPYPLPLPWRHAHRPSEWTDGRGRFLHGRASRHASWPAATRRRRSRPRRGGCRCGSCTGLPGPPRLATFSVSRASTWPARSAATLPTGHMSRYRVRLPAPRAPCLPVYVHSRERMAWCR
jgi:hypothetical protein